MGGREGSGRIIWSLLIASLLAGTAAGHGLWGYDAGASPSTAPLSAQEQQRRAPRLSDGPGRVRAAAVAPQVATIADAGAGDRASAKARELVSKMTLQEKLTQLHNKQSAVPRLGLPQFDFLSECLHGYWEQDSTAKAPTIFPQPLVMASSFDRDLITRVFTAVGDEMRARNNEHYARTKENKALTCWTPHMNILRDPRWGRGSETWGEDPHLTSVMAAHVVRALQGQDPNYVKVAATCKHFMGYSLEMADGQSRYSFNATLAPQDIVDTYLPAFDACVRAANVQGIMCAYNAVDGTPMCANGARLRGLLRNRWKFGGYVVSDCNAVAAFKWGHRYSPDDAKAIAAAIKAGTDILCDNMDTRKAAADAVAQGLLTEADIDGALVNTLRVRAKTGQLEPPGATPWAKLTMAVVNSPEHQQLARSAAVKGIVMLKNDPPKGSTSRLLPINKSRVRSACVVGPLAASTEHMMGNYYGAWDKSSLSPLKAIQEALSGVNIKFDDALRPLGINYYDWPLESALEACRSADVALVFVGASMIATPPAPNNARLESWKPVSEGEGFDREGTQLPGRQLDLVKALATRNPDVPIALVVLNGGPVDLSWAQGSPTVAAILAAGFPGQEGGRAIADILFGRASPSGRLPNTWYHANYTAAVAMTDMGMRPNATRRYPGRTYRFVEDPGYVQYPFGHGLSYTTFGYSNLQVFPVKDSGGRCGPYEGAAFCVGVTVTNTGAFPGEEVVMMFLTNPARAGKDGFPLKALRGFTRTPTLQPGASATVQLPLGTLDFTVPNREGLNVLRLGAWAAQVGPLSAPVLASRQSVDRKAVVLSWPARGGKSLLSTSL